MRHLPDPDRQPQFYDSVAPKRLVAWIIDSVLIFLAAALVVVFTAFVGLLIWPLLYVVIGFFYRFVTLANASATPGMLFTGMEIRSGDGARLSNAQAFWHTFGYSVSIAMPLLQVISVAMMLTTARGQGLSDALLGTVALHKKRVYAG